MKTFFLKTIILVIVFIAIITRGYVFAADDNNNPNGYTCNISFTPDKASVKPGEDITYEVKVSNINAGNGIKMVELYLGNYDSNLFECKIRNYNEDKWTLSNVSERVTISENAIGSWNTDETLMKIIYTPKTGVPDNTYQISVSNIVITAEDESLISMNDTNLNVKVETPNQTANDPIGGTPSNNYSCKVDFTPDKTSVKPEESITYNLKVSDINAGNGIKNIEFNAGNYNANVFDCVVRNYDESKWSITAQNGTISISSNNSQPWKSDEVLAQIVYTPKKGIAANTYQTTISGITATTDSGEKITLSDVTLNIKVDQTQESSSENNNSTDENKSSNKESNTSTSSSKKNTEKTSSNGKNNLPYSGYMENVAIALGIMAFGAVSVLCYIRYKNLNIK